MKRLLVLLVLLLSGCSAITIDELEPQEQREHEADSVEQRKPGVEEVEAVQNLDVLTWEPTEEQGFFETVEHLFGIDFTDSKSSDAAPLTYLALGDSLTRGVGDEKMKYGYTDRLALAMEQWPEITKVELDNRGKNGRRSDQLLKLLKRGHYDNELPTADLITITLGGNDVMRVVKADLFKLDKTQFDKALVNFEKRYAQVIAEIRKRNTTAPLILIGFYNPFHIVTDEYTPFEKVIDEWNTSIMETAKQDINACFVPVADLFVTNDELIYHTDFFHPNGNGYDKIAMRIIETMQACNIREMSDGRIGFEE